MVKESFSASSVHRQTAIALLTEFIQTKKTDFTIQDVALHPLAAHAKGAGQMSTSQTAIAARLRTLTRWAKIAAKPIMHPVSLVALSFGQILLWSKLYIDFSVTRIRCHEPSMEFWDHILFEVFPIGLLIVVISASIMASFSALQTSQSVLYTLGVVVLIFTYSVCCFALLYHQYGLIEATSANDVAFLQFLMLQELLKSGAGIAPDLNIIDQGVYIGDFFMNFHEAGIETQIAQDPMTYFAYSLSSILPGMPVYKPVALCPSAYYVGVAQSFTNVLMGLTTVILFARVSAFAKTEKDR